MVKYDLTPDQKDLLRLLVQDANEHRSKEFSLMIIRGDDREDIFIWVNGDRILTQCTRGDLEALFSEGLLIDLDSKFTLRQSAFDAVANDFEKPPTTSPAINIGAMIGRMDGGNVQVAQGSDISQIINDPDLLRVTLDEITATLLDAVRNELPGRALLEYSRQIDELKALLLAQSPDPSRLQQIAGALAFFGDIEGTIALSVRVLPLIRSLLTIAQYLIN